MEAMQPTQNLAIASAGAQGVAPLPTASSEERLMLTAAEYRAYEAELASLHERRDRELPERLRDARTYVTADAIEEIAQIQEQQTVAAVRIARLEDLLANASVIPDDEAGEVVSIGSLVDIEYRRSGRRAVYRLTGAGRAADGRSVSARSPIGQALMGRRAGELVRAELPSGRVEQLRIVAITPAFAHAP
jgi:transcription elongation factor GreA